ncbi:hypothetical protein [Methylobacterium sp. CM6257]|jgi:hypothetical protein
MAEEQHTAGQPARPLPECLTRLLTDPKEQIQRVTPSLASDPRPRLFDRVLWWFNIVMFGAAALIFSATLTVRMLQ